MAAFFMWRTNTNHVRHVVFFLGVFVDYLFKVLNSLLVLFFVSGWIRIEHRLTRIEVLLQAVGINGGDKRL